MNVQWSELSPGMQLAVAVLAVIQATLWLVALVSWARTPPERMTLPRLAWLAVILVVNIIGPIAWFVAGRQAAPVHQAPPTQDWGNKQQRAVDTLFGERTGEK
ncbi:PLD nuclease N-terminal domain-containing protein [Luteococcus sp. OSA5]|uniref:PLD nuclease N-terminal domain-containing protein n=1 Tax=Luteococcus sp. OSA5 TaxID=3401630 RepID=UPI003B43532B